MDPTIALIRNYGHQYNPLIRGLFAGLSEEDWETVTPLEYRGQALIASYQMTLADAFEPLTLRHHGRLPHFDGDLGPATLDLLNVSRCGCPDFEALEELDARGGGSWPAGCFPDLYRDHAIKVHYDLGNAPSRIKGWWPEIQEMVHAAYAETGLMLVETKSRSEANLQVWFEVLAGSTIGLAQLPGGGARCNLRLWCKLDPGYEVNANQEAQLLAHELGHNVNSGHISGDPIMHPSMRTQHWNGSFKGTAFGNRLSGYFGGVAVPKPEPPVPPVPPAPIPPFPPPFPPVTDPLLRLRVSDPATGKQYILKELPSFGD
jgi:hypothetical protein